MAINVSRENKILHKYIIYILNIINYDTYYTLNFVYNVMSVDNIV